MAYVRVAVNLPGISGEYDYHLPAELEGRLGAGHLVTLPFGRQTAQGVVLELLAKPATAETKAVRDLLDPLPVLTVAQLALARWMAEAFHAPLAAMIGLMVPSGLNQQADTLFEILRAGQPESAPAGQVETRLLTLLADRGALRSRQIDRHFNRVDWRRVARQLVLRGVLSSRSVLPPPVVRPKFVRTAQLCVPPETALAAMPEVGRSAATRARRQAALRFLLNEPGAVAVSWVYAASGCNLADLQELDERGLISLGESEVWRDPLEKVALDLEQNPPETGREPALTAEQEAVWQCIQAAFDNPADQPPFLIQGVTGSGKTELYLRAAAQVVRQDKAALILVPEIAITPQTVRRFLQRFPGQVGLIHSRLSPGERYDTWRRARLGLLKVIIGPRSALFAPLPKVGLIVADECHDPSFSQSEPPCYHAIPAAEQYARLCGAVCLLGSATPSIVQRYQAEAGHSLRLLLPRRILNPDLPPVEIVDMREELKKGNRAIFSQSLKEALTGVLARQEQAILFLNRRGTATYIFCRTCGYVARCPQCDIPLTLHTDLPAAGEDGLLVCHRCGYHRRLPGKCPDCHGPHIRAYGLGSEKVEAEVRAMFPQARTLRWDWETTRQKDAHEIILGHFSAHRADILVGTQMLAKGLDLPLVTLVGILLAEVGLNLPDPFAPERTFSLLTQVAGRAGRSARGGRVVLQTFQPDHYVIQFASSHDVDGFYSRELEERRRLGYPPFSRLVRLEYRNMDPLKAEAEAQRLAQALAASRDQQGRLQTELIGPVPCFFTRQDGLYRWQIVLRGPQPLTLLQGLRLDGWRLEVDPTSLL